MPNIHARNLGKRSRYSDGELGTLRLLMQCACRHPSTFEKQNTVSTPGTLQVLHNGSKESALLPVGFQAGTLQVVPSDEHPSGLQVCSAAAFCVNIWYPAPGELDFVAHVDAKEHGSGLLSMTTLEDWFAVLTDGPPTVDDGPCSQPTQQPIAALETLRPYTHKRSMLLQGRMQQLGRSTI